MLLPSHLRRSRHGVFYFRIVLPPSIADALGQGELVRSLGIRCPKLAKLSGYQIWGHLSPLLERLARLMSIDPNSVSTDDVRKLIVEGLQIGADGSFSAARIETSKNPKVAEQEMKSLLALAQARRDSDRADGVSPQSRAKLEDEARQLKAEIAQWANDKPAPPRPTTLQATHDSYMLTKKGIAEATKKAYRESFAIFAAMMGGAMRMVHDIEEAEVQEFNEALALVPKHAKKRGIAITSAKTMLLDPPKGVAKDGSAIEWDVISGETANLHCTNLQGFFDFAISSGRRLGHNPFTKLKRHSDGEQGGGADGFTEGELNAIFDPVTFMQAKRPTQFWAPLLALYTGARLNELACLELADFVMEKGIPCISIRHIPRAKPSTIEHKNKPSARQTKNAASRRMVPLHPDLFEIGIEHYIDDMKSVGAQRFFPTLPEDSRHKRERRLSYDGNEYLKLVGVHVERVKVMHSFRDTVCEMLGVSDMDDVRADQWTGHKNQSVKGRHYRSKAAIDLQARDGFKALDFPCIDVERLQYRKDWWNAWTLKNMVP